MSLITSRALRLLIKFKKSLFDIPVQEQKEYLGSFDEPADDIQRSYYQYKCQQIYLNRVVDIIQNFVCFLLLMPIALFLLCKKNPKFRVKEENLVSMDGLSNECILPYEVRTWRQFLLNEGYNLRLSDIKFLLTIFIRYPFSSYFLLKITLKVAQYRYVIDQYSPVNICVHSEYSFTSSILTSYCSRHCITHINMMHGEKLYDITDSFFRFDVCYVWDVHYIELFKMLRAENNNFKVSIPQTLIVEKYNQDIDPNYSTDFKYYLGNETDTELIRIVDLMNHLKSTGYKVVFRPHPRYTNTSLLKQLVPENNIEDTSISIETSISNTMNIVSLYSTVLQQGYNAKRKIVIDDITNPKHFEQLKELNYIMLAKPHIRLSSVINIKKC